MNFRKAQSAIEFVILVMAVFFLFVGLFYFVEEKIVDSRREVNSIAVREVALTIQEEINLAEGASEGYSRQFVIPAKINGMTYSANITAGFVYVRTIDGKNAIALPVPALSGNLILGVNSISKINNSLRLNN